MKKAFCFSLIVMFLALASSPLLVKADDVAVVTPYQDSASLTSQQITDLTNTSLLIEYLRKGGTIDVKNTSSDYDFSDLISDFGDFVGDVIGDVVDLVNPFQSQFQWEGYHPVKVAEPSIMQFMGLLPFYAISQSENIPDPDPDYLSLINEINDNNLDWINASNPNPAYPTYYLVSPMSHLSMCAYEFSNDTNSVLGQYAYQIYSSVCNIYINNISEDTYFYTVTPQLTFVFHENSGDYNVGQYRNNYPNGGLITNRSELKTPPTYQYQGTLENCLKNIRANFHNVNIYVDNKPWSIVSNPQSYNIEISTGTSVPIKDGTGKVEWLYDYEIYFDMERIQEDLNSLLHLIKNNPNTPTIIKFDDIEDCIVDVDGQPAVAVKVLADTRNIDQIYIDNYGPIIPAFLPMFTPVIDDSDIFDIASTAISPIPEDLLEVFGYMFIGVLFIGFIHRLLE